jgi:hypothetical protein
MSNHSEIRKRVADLVKTAFESIANAQQVDGEREQRHGTIVAMVVRRRE